MTTTLEHSNGRVERKAREMLLELAQSGETSTLLGHQLSKRRLDRGAGSRQRIIYVVRCLILSQYHMRLIASHGFSSSSVGASISTDWRAFGLRPKSVNRRAANVLVVISIR